jgi:hypothetical protein
MVVCHANVSGARGGCICDGTHVCFACKSGMGMDRIQFQNRELLVRGVAGLLCHRRICRCTGAGGRCMDGCACLGVSCVNVRKFTFVKFLRERLGTSVMPW